MAGPLEKENTMSRTYTFHYLQTRSLPELYALRLTLQQQRAALPPGSAAHSEIAQVLERIHWLLASRAPGFRPR